MDLIKAELERKKKEREAKLGGGAAGMHCGALWGWMLGIYGMGWSGDAAAGGGGGMIDPIFLTTTTTTTTPTHCHAMPCNAPHRAHRGGAGRGQVFPAGGPAQGGGGDAAAGTGGWVSVEGR